MKVSLKQWCIKSPVVLLKLTTSLVPQINYRRWYTFCAIVVFVWRERRKPQNFIKYNWRGSIISIWTITGPVIATPTHVA